MKPEKPARISRVHRTGGPVAGMSVTAYTASGTVYAGSTTTDASGHYTVGGLSAGQYVVRFSPQIGVNYIGTYYNAKSAANA